MNPMKKIFCSLLFLLSGLLLTAQTIENPTFKARNGSIRNITRIERTPQCTKVYIHAIFRPHWWITTAIWKMPPLANATHKREPKASS